MADYFEERIKDINNQIDRMLEEADMEGYHRGYDEAWDESRDKGFDEGFEEGVMVGHNEGVHIGADAIIEEITKELIPSTDFFPTPESQAQYEAMLNDYKDMGAMCVAITLNWLNVKISEMNKDDEDA
jgi:hypothetical protein